MFEMTGDDFVPKEKADTELSKEIKDNGYIDHAIKNFKGFVEYDTQSKDLDDESLLEKGPSTEGQNKFCDYLEEEMKEMKLEVERGKTGYVYAHLPSNIEDDKKRRKIGFAAHVDTSPAASGKDVKPIEHDYEGGDIELKNDVIIPEKDLLPYKGDKIITSDGTTLLGADDKAGIAEIFTIIKYLQEHPEIKRPDIYVMFEHDEEIGGQVGNFEKEKFPVDVCYTFDGASLGEFEIETFNAASAKVKITGNGSHPGYKEWGRASAVITGCDLINSVPKEFLAQNTGDRESYFEPYNVGSGNAASWEIPLCLIRSFTKRGNKDVLTEMGREDIKEWFTELVGEVNERHPGVSIDVEYKDQYDNMFENMKNYPFVVENAKEAFERSEVEIVEKPIRGGTDGSAMTMNYDIPTPNIFAGGINFHSVTEFLPVQVMAKSVEVGINLVKVYGEQPIEE